MKKEENLTNFDLSVLSLSELIKLNEHINDFIKFLDEKKITYSINKDSFTIGEDILVEKGENKSFTSIIKITLDKFIQKLIDE